MFFYLKKQARNFGFFLLGHIDKILVFGIILLLIGYLYLLFFTEVFKMRPLTF